MRRSFPTCAGRWSSSSRTWSGATRRITASCCSPTICSSTSAWRNSTAWQRREGERIRPVKFDPAQRAGIFTHPFLLSAFSYHKCSSPIHRGVFLTRNVLGRSLKPPPMAIEFMDDHFDPSLTMREKVTELTSKRACMSCHSTINPLGFSLENYDAVGRFRTTDNNKPVNAESDYSTADGETSGCAARATSRCTRRRAMSTPRLRAAVVPLHGQATARGLWPGHAGRTRRSFAPRANMSEARR